MNENQQLLENLKSSIKLLLGAHAARSTPVTDDSEHAGPLIDSIHAILKHRLKERVNGFVVSYWNFLAQIQKMGGDLAAQAALMHTEVEKVRQDWSTEDEKGRTWLKLGFNSTKIYPLLKSLFNEKSIVEAWYEPGAFLLNPDLIEIFSKLLIGLSNLRFELSLDQKSEKAAPFEPIQTFRVKKSSRNISNKKDSRRKKDVEEDFSLVEERRRA